MCPEVDFKVSPPLTLDNIWSFGPSSSTERPHRLVERGRPRPPNVSVPPACTVTAPDRTLRAPTYDQPMMVTGSPTHDCDHDTSSLRLPARLSPRPNKNLSLASSSPPTLTQALAVQ